MYLQILKDFFGRRDVKYFLTFCLSCYVLFILICMFSDVDLHKKKIKDNKNKIKLQNQKQNKVSKSEV